MKLWESSAIKDQQVKVLATNPDDLSLVPGTHIVEPTHCPLNSRCAVVSAHIHTYVSRCAIVSAYTHAYVSSKCVHTFICVCVTVIKIFFKL